MEREVSATTLLFSPQKKKPPVPILQEVWKSLAASLDGPKGFEQSSESLYRLRYPSPYNTFIQKIKPLERTDAINVAEEKHGNYTNQFICSL